MNVSMTDVLRGEIPPGVYTTRSRFRPVTIRRTVEKRGWRFFYLDGSSIEDKASFLKTIAEVMSFPSSFGRNWDALNDSINDLSWVAARGYVLLYDNAAHFAEARPDDWEVAHEILSDATNRWRANGVPFFVVVREIA